MDSSNDEHLEENGTAKKVIIHSYLFYTRWYWERNRQLEGNRSLRCLKDPGIPISTKRTQRWVTSVFTDSKKTLISEKKKTRYQESDDDVEEGTSTQSSRSNDDEDDYDSMYADEEPDDEVPIDELPAPKGQSKKRPGATPKQNMKSTPMSPQHSTSLNDGVKGGTTRKGSQTKNAARSKTKKAPKQKVGLAPVYPQFSNSFINGSGNMVNDNVGNLNYSIIEDAFNDNSVNSFNGRR